WPWRSRWASGWRATCARWRCWNRRCRPWSPPPRWRSRTAWRRGWRPRWSATASCCRWRRCRRGTSCCSGCRAERHGPRARAACRTMHAPLASPGPAMDAEDLLRAALREAGYGADAIGSAMPQIIRILQAEDVRIEAGRTLSRKEREYVRVQLELGLDVSEIVAGLKR